MRPYIAWFGYLTETERAYIAGLVDGEGSFNCLRNGYPRFTLFMTDKPTIEWLAHRLNTTVREQPRGSDRWKRIWGVRLHGRDVQSLIRVVRPYLITKAAKADEFMLWQPMKNGPRPSTHCKYGHEFTPENTRRRKNGTKTCIACQRARDKVRVRVWVPRRERANH